MTRKIKKFLLVLCYNLVAFTFFLGCATSPNLPFAGRPYPAILDELSKKNPLLVQELGKLPEIQDQILPSEMAALDRINTLYDAKPRRFDEIFEKLYQVGLPEVRSYCSPLQALFWISEDRELNWDSDLMNHFTLEKLFGIAWNFDPPSLPDQEIADILNGIKDEKIKRLYKKDWKRYGSARLQTFLLLDAKRMKKEFSRDAIKKINGIKAVNPRWRDFDQVVERLNAPEVIDFYTRKRIDWVDWRSLPKWPVSPRYVFKNSSGDCTAISDFIALCLTKGGYKAYEFKVPPTRSVDAHHSVCIYEYIGNKYVIDNGRVLKSGIKPFDYLKTYY